MIVKWLFSSPESSRKNFFSCGWAAAFDIRSYISRPAASKASAFRMTAAASPEITFSLRIRLYSFRNIFILSSEGAFDTLGNFPFSSSAFAIARISSQCFSSIRASSSNSWRAKGSALRFAAEENSRFPSFSNFNALASAASVPPFARAGLAFFMASPCPVSGCSYPFCLPALRFSTIFRLRRAAGRPSRSLPPLGTATGLEDLFPDPDRGRGHLDQLVLVDELDRLLHQHRPGRDQPERLVGPRRPDVRELLLLGRVHVHVHRAGVLADHHPLVHPLPIPDEEGPPRLEVEEGVCGGAAGPGGGQGPRG